MIRIGSDGKGETIMGKVSLSSSILTEVRKKAVEDACIPKKLREKYTVTVNNDGDIVLCKGNTDDSLSGQRQECEPETPFAGGGPYGLGR